MIQRHPAGAVKAGEQQRDLRVWMVCLGCRDCPGCLVWVSDDGKNRNAEADDNDSGLRHAGDDPRIAAAPRFVDPLTDALAVENRPSHREAFVLTDAMPS